MKLKHIALAVLAATSFGAAHAVAVDTGVGTATVFFAARDVNQTQSYVFNTGASFNDLAAGSLNFTKNFSTDSVFTQFLADVGGIGNIQWEVGALQAGSGTDKKYISTLGAGALNASLPAGSNGTFGTAVNTLNNILQSSDNTESAAGTGTYLTVTSFTTYGVSSFLSSVGANVGFFGVQTSSTANAGKLNKLVIDAAQKATFSNTGVLTISAVPEPESYGLALVGLVLAGAVARRRAAK